jgi:peptidoglycan/LPS O-acetylase OafA/YrhL
MTIVHPIFAIAISAIAVLFCICLGRIRPTGLPTGRYQSIDGLRGYLAFFVFLHHTSISYFFVVIGKWQSPPSNLFTHLGESSVILFFMITGFLFYGKALDAHNRKIDWPKFFIARILRLTPLYIVVVIILMILVIVESNSILVDSEFNVAKSATKWFLFTFFGAPSVNGVYVPRFIAGVNWSLPYEWYFYLSMPLLAMTQKVKVSWQFILLSISALIYASTAGLQFFYIVVFAVGLIAAFLVRNPTFIRYATTKSASALALVCLGILIFYYPTAYGYTQLGLLAVVFLLIAGGTDLFGSLSAKSSHFLGELSYSIYLLHGLILFIFLKYVISYDTVRNMSAITYWSTIGGLVPILLCIAVLTFRMIELPGMRLTEKVMANVRLLGRKRIAPDDDLLNNPVSRKTGGSAF